MREGQDFTDKKGEIYIYLDTGFIDLGDPRQ
jgi:hypothetical protein